MQKKISSGKLSIFLFSVAIVVFYWLVDAAVESFIFRYGSFISQLINPGEHEIWRRLFVSAILILLGVLVQYVIIRFRKIESSLRESEKRYRTLAEAAQDMIFIIDRDDYVQYVNNFAAEQFGRKPQDIIGRNRGELFPSGVSDRQRHFLQKVFETGKPIHVEDRIVFPDKEMWVSSSLVPLVGGAGEVNAVMGVSRDITESRKALEALKESEERYESVVENIGIGISVISPDMEILALNSQMRKWFPDIDISGRPICYRAFNCPPGENICSYCPTSKTFADGRIHESITDTPLGGEIIHYRLLSSPVKDAEGKVIAAIEMVEDITERLAAEKALQKSEQAYRELVENARDVIYNISADGTILSLNPAFETITGWTQSEWLGKNFASLIHPDDLPLALTLFQETLQGEFPDIYEFRVLAKSGTVIGEFLAKPKVVNGKVVGVFGIARDITGRKRAEQALQESEEKYRLLFQHAPIGVFHYDQKMLITECNERFETILQSSRERLIGLDMKSLKDQSVIPAIRSALEGNDGFYEGFYHATTSSAEIWVSMQTAPLFDQKGGIKGGIGIVEDITERKKMEDKLFQITHDWEDTFNTLTDMVTVHDKDFNIIHANKAAEKILGLPFLEFGPVKCYKFYHGLGGPPEGCPSCDCLVTGEPATSEIYEPHLNMFLEIRAIPRFDSGNNLVGLIHVVRDITGWKKLEDQLRQAQKMEAIGRLAGGVAHDFNNMLTAIIGYANILKMKMGKDDPLKVNLDQILAVSERGAYLTQSLLTFSRQQISNPEPVNIDSIIRRTERLLERVIGEDIELKTMLHGDLTVMADRAQIDQVLMNLCTNARDAMPHGGALTIETGLVELDREFITAHGYGKSGRYAVVSVSDTGTGISDNIMGKIFDPFFTTKEVGKGTGLGLSIVYGIIKQHNGYITCYSELGRGTTFKIYLPVIGVEAKEEEPEDLYELKGAPVVILLAEDGTSVREATKKILEGYGHEVIEAVNGKDALIKFAENKDKIELLIFDVIMPQMNGKKAYDRIRAIKPDIKALFTSGYPADFIHSREIIEEGLNFISKPISPAALLRKVKEVLGR